MVTLVDDETLTRLLVEANPARTPPDAQPDAEIRRIRAQLMAPARVRRRARGARLAWGSALVAAAAAVAFVVGVLVPNGPAVAVTPAPLIFADAGSAAQIVDRAATALSERQGPQTPTRTVETVSWSLAVDVDEQHMAVVPQFSRLTWNEDLSGHLTIIEGKPYWPSDAPAGSVEAVIGDEVLVDSAFEPGQYTTPVVAPPGDSLEEVTAMLAAFGMPDDPTAGDVMIALYTALDQWTLTDEQQRQLLGYLVSRDGVEAVGSTTDRLGRAVDAIRVVASRGVSDTVLISQQTGRIVGIETQQLEGDGIIPAGAVVSYRLWDLFDERNP